MEHADDVTSIFGGHAYPSPTNGIPTDVTDESFYSAYLKLIQATATRVRQRTGKRFVVKSPAAVCPAILPRGRLTQTVAANRSAKPAATASPATARVRAGRPSPARSTMTRRMKSLGR